jgi:hypothetical protein
VECNPGLGKVQPDNSKRFCQDQDDGGYVVSHLSTVVIDLVGELVEMLRATRDQRNPVAQLAEQATGRLVSSPYVGLVESPYADEAPVPARKSVL